MRVERRARRDEPTTTKTTSSAAAALSFLAAVWATLRDDSLTRVREQVRGREEMWCDVGVNIEKWLSVVDCSFFQI